MKNQTVSIEEFMTGTIREYAFHDTDLRRVEIVRDGVKLVFPEGIYQTDEHGKELFLTPSCEIVLRIRDFDPANVWEHVSVLKQVRKKVSDLAFSAFADRVEKDAFRIYMQYCSFFSSALLFKGEVGKIDVEWEITEIENISLHFFDESKKA